MNVTKKIYWYLLIAALVIYIIGSTILQSQLIIKVGELDHQLWHLTYERETAYPLSDLGQ